MECVICNRRQSLCCRDGEVFRKYFKYADKQSVEHEGEYSRLYESFGITTPHFIRTGFSTEQNLFFNEYRYMEMRSFDETNFDESLFPNVLAMLNRVLAARVLPDGSEFRNRRYKTDLVYALDVLKNRGNVDASLMLEKFLEQEISVVMHGDFSLSNMALVGDDICLYDFASAGCAPQWWDLGYFIASLSPNLGRKLYEPLRSENLSDCIRLAAAVRFGRALRKNEDVPKRQCIFEYWSEISS